MFQIIPLHTHDFFATTCLAMMLFWRRRSLNILIIVHTAIALVLFNRAMAFHSGNILDPATTGEFTGVIGLVQDGLKPFLFIWLYEWWYIGRRRSELGFED